MPTLSYKQKALNRTLNDLLVGNTKLTIMAGLNEFRQQLQNSLKCEICDEEFESNKGLKNHFNIVHKLMKEPQCNICQNVFNRDRFCRFEVSGRSKIFLSLMSFDSLWDIQMCKQKLFTMHND